MVRVFQRRPLDHSLRDQLVDEAFARYLDWLAAEEAANAAYSAWSRRTPTGGALGFAAYGAALDREERAASVYGSVVDEVAQLLGAGEERVAAAQRRAAPA